MGILSLVSYLSGFYIFSYLVLVSLSGYFFYKTVKYSQHFRRSNTIVLSHAQYTKELLNTITATDDKMITAIENEDMGFFLSQTFPSVKNIFQSLERDIMIIVPKEKYSINLLLLNSDTIIDKNQINRDELSDIKCYYLYGIGEFQNKKRESFNLFGATEEMMDLMGKQVREDILNIEKGEFESLLSIEVENNNVSDYFGFVEIKLNCKSITKEDINLFKQITLEKVCFLRYYIEALNVSITNLERVLDCEVDFLKEVRTLRELFKEG